MKGEREKRGRGGGMKVKRYEARSNTGTRGAIFRIDSKNVLTRVRK
jgi:hypothetical protein